MKIRYGNVALIVGASSGVGKACAEFLANQGYSVYGTSRKASYESLSDSKINMLPLDVTKTETIDRAIQYVLEKEGEINVLINCPGYGLTGAVEDLSSLEVHDIFETNFFGIMMMCQKIIPIMRKQKKGLIVNISSVAGFISIPFQSMYSATKYALEAMTEALRIEVKPFGVRVSLIEPGDMKTEFSRVTTKNFQESVYHDQCQNAVNEMIRSEQKGPDASVVIKELKKILKSKNPPIRRVVGFQYKLISILKRFMPSKIVEYFVTKIYQ